MQILLVFRDGGFLFWTLTKKKKKKWKTSVEVELMEFLLNLFLIWFKFIISKEPKAYYTFRLRMANKVNELRITKLNHLSTFVGSNALNTDLLSNQNPNIIKWKFAEVGELTANSLLKLNVTWKMHSVVLMIWENKRTCSLCKLKQCNWMQTK